MRPRIIQYLNEMFSTTIFHWAIPTPNQVYGLAFLTVGVLFLMRSRQNRLSLPVILNCFWIGGVGAFLGAKLMYVILHLPSYILMPSHIFASGGTVSWGAYLGALAALSVYLHYKRQPVSRFLDILAATLPLGTFMGRWSCFLNGDDFGKLTTASWGVRYPQGSYPFAEHVHEGIISYSATFSAPVHPNQLYLSINALVIFAAVSWFWKRYHHYPGLTLGLYASMYGFTRFFLEFFRHEVPLPWLPELIFPQLMSLSIMLTGLLITLYLLRRYNLFILIRQKIQPPITERIQL